MEAIQRILGTVSNSLRGVSPRAGFLAAFLFLIISLFLVELPTWLLDFLLVVNILIALTLVFRAILLDSAVKLHSFPTILVLTTLFRLSLNVSSTKLVLLHGDKGLDAAGKVIETFGRSVVGGDFLVGAIVFGIIAIVNFVVIAKGSARVAEVSARFNLDALPGKQLSIDAALRSGTITPEEAAAQRRALSLESQFFGSMDGAMKWVQGDAIAGLSITFINAVGGVALGVSRGLTPAESVNTFGILTVGDGLVSILPSLLISVCAGIIVTQVADKEEEGPGEAIFEQLFSDSRAIVVSAVSFLLVGLFGFIGVISVPALPFFAVGVLTLVIVGGAELRAEKVLPAKSVTVETIPAVGGTAPGLSYQMTDLALRVDRRLLAAYLGMPKDVSLVAEGRTNTESSEYQRLQEFFKILAGVRERNLKEKGVLIPTLSLLVADDLSPGSYEVLVREQIVKRGSLRIDHAFVAANAGLLGVFDFTVERSVRHPLRQQSACWVSAKQPGLSALRHLGIEMHNPASFLVLECLASVLQVIEEVFGVDESRQLSKPIEQNYPELYQEVLGSSVLSMAEFTEILRRLVREHASIRDVKLIFEGIVEFAAIHTDIEDRQEWLSELHAFLRMVLSRNILSDALGPGDKLRTFVLASEIEDEFRSAISMWDHARSRLPLEPAFEASLRESTNRIFTPVLERGVVPIVVLCPGDIRVAVQDFFGRQMENSEWLRTLAYQELGSAPRPESIGVIGVSN